MFTQAQIRKSLCMIAMTSLHRDRIEIGPRSVLDRLISITMACHYGEPIPIHIEEIITEDARIENARNIASTVRSLLKDLEDPPSLIG